MQIDAPINRGNSGGPTFDVSGRVVGVNTAIYSPSGGSVGIGFAIPASLAQSVTRQLIASGKVARGYLGATVQDITPEIASALGRPGLHGALVADVTPNGPAAKAGLRSGDVVTRVNGVDVASNVALTRQVASVQSGGVMHVEGLRNGKPIAFDVRSGLRPSEDQIAKLDGQGDDSGEG
jgi:serine protease Do